MFFRKSLTLGGGGGDEIARSMDFVKTNVKFDNPALANCNKTISATTTLHRVIYLNDTTNTFNKYTTWSLCLAILSHLRTQGVSRVCPVNVVSCRDDSCVNYRTATERRTSSVGLLRSTLLPK